jgi:hypothetical protein
VTEQVWVALVRGRASASRRDLELRRFKRPLKRSIGGNPGLPLREVLAHMQSRADQRFDRLETKVDEVVEQTAVMR